VVARLGAGRRAARRGVRPAGSAAVTGRPRLAAIDVGTNSIRLIVAQARPDGGYRVLDDEKEVTRLGEGPGAALTADAMARSAEAIERLVRIARGHGADLVRVVATSAVREAPNAEDFARLVRESAGLEPEIISGDEEARLACLSAGHAFELRDAPVAIVDVGGGSTEIVIACAGVVEHVWSLPLGAVRLTERFGPCDDPEGEALGRLNRCVKRALRQAGVRADAPLSVMIGSGGTFTNLARVSMRNRRAGRGRDAPLSSVQGHEMLRDEVKRIELRLARRSVAERAATPGVSPERADIIVAGVAIVDRVMKRLGVNRLRVNEGGVRDGLLLEMVSALTAGRGPDPAKRAASARRFAESSGYERDHAEHVARLALSVFDQLAALQPGCIGDRVETARARELLESAAVLHDIGYLIAYAKHHKHSHHIIMHSEITGFTPRERRIIANVARYHRRAEPKPGHRSYAGLEREDRRLVRRLSAILRVADGLDRTHTQSVAAVTLRRREGGWALEARSARDASADVWGAGRKAGLFEREFGHLEIRLARDEPTGPTASAATRPVGRP